MFQSVQKKHNEQTTVMAIDVAPLIDIVFILLIFFMVTTTFITDHGLTIDRPRATESQPLNPQNIRITIMPSGNLYLQGQPTTDDEALNALRIFNQKNPTLSAIIIPDQTLPAARLIQIIDLAKKSGITDIAIATQNDLD